MTNNKERSMYKKFMLDMMDSCHTYGSIEGYQYEQYIAKYRAKLGDKIFESIYKYYGAWLKRNTSVEANTFTDTEGLSYNTLVVNGRARKG